MPETVSVVQEDEVKVNPFEPSWRDAETLAFIDELDKKEAAEKAEQERLKQIAEEIDSRYEGSSYTKPPDQAGYMTQVTIKADGSLKIYSLTDQKEQTLAGLNEQQYRQETLDPLLGIGLAESADAGSRTLGVSLRVGEIQYGPNGEQIITYFSTMLTENSIIFSEDDMLSDEQAVNSEIEIAQYSEQPIPTEDVVENKIEGAEVGILSEESKKLPEKVFSLESLFFAPENTISSNQELRSKENSFLNLEFLSPANPESINIMSSETKEVANLVTQEIKQSTIQQREEYESVSIESPTAKPSAAREVQFQIKDIQSSAVAERVHVASEKSVGSIQEHQEHVEKPTENRTQAVQREKTSIISNSETPNFQPEVSKPSEVVNKPEATITISFSEKPQTSEHTIHVEARPSPAETVRTTMRPVAETRISISPTASTTKIEWGNQNVVDVMPPSITANLQQSMQELSHSPVGKEMVLTGTEARNDTALIFRVEQPGKVTVELYKARETEVAEKINPVTEITQAPVETVQAEPIQGVEQLTSEPVIPNEIASANESLIDQNEKPAEAITQAETIAIQPTENTSPENRRVASTVETPIINQDIEAASPVSVTNNSERRRLTISSFFPEEDNEPTLSPTPREQSAAANSRQLTA